jgi:adenine-specific DNA-methyltransferase
MIYELELQGKVDLTYIDPPFSTNNVFKISDDKINTISSGLRRIK